MRDEEKFDRLSLQSRTVLEKRRAGSTYRVIARELDLSSERIRQIEHRALREMEAMDNDPLYGLSARTRTILHKLGLTSRAQVAEVMKNPNRLVLRPGTPRNCGRKTVREIRAWLGWEVPVLGDPQL